MPRTFQTTWNGIDLLDVAKAPNMLAGGVPTPQFYAEFYSRLRDKGLPISAQWMQEKASNSRYLEGVIAAEARKQGKDPQELRVLSVGAGLGLVELPLIAKGFRIQLHEVQEESLDLARKHAAELGITQLETWVGELAELPPSDFDLLYLGTCEYCFAQPDRYERFLRSVCRQLKVGGAVVAVDPHPSWRHYLADFLVKLGVKKAVGVYWGMLRSLRERTTTFRRAGLTLEAFEVCDAHFNIVRSSNTHRDFPFLELMFPMGTMAVLTARKVERKS